MRTPWKWGHFESVPRVSLFDRCDCRLTC
jgi:hypothetical protein